jgi:hypothetical protein
MAVFDKVKARLLLLKAIKKDRFRGLPGNSI